MTTAEWVLLGMFFGACAWAGCLWEALLREQRLCDEYRVRLQVMTAWYGKGKADDDRT